MDYCYAIEEQVYLSRHTLAGLSAVTARSSDDLSDWAWPATDRTAADVA